MGVSADDDLKRIFGEKPFILGTKKNCNVSEGFASWRFQTTYRAEFTEGVLPKVRGRHLEKIGEVIP